MCKDLQPYVCTFPNCENADQTYESRKSFISHEIAKHRGFDTWNVPTERIYQRTIPLSDCPFCGEAIGGARSLKCHLGKHLEEVAFAVVTRPYEEWEFYSDSSSSKSARQTATADRQQISFSNEVVTRTISGDLHQDSDGVSDNDEDDDEEDIEVDDSSEWDSISQNGRLSPNEKSLFQRVDSTRTLTSRRSLLTNLLHESQRADAFAKVAAQSTHAPSHRALRSPHADVLLSAHHRFPRSCDDLKGLRCRLRHDPSVQACCRAQFAPGRRCRSRSACPANLDRTAMFEGARSNVFHSAARLNCMMQDYSSVAKGW